jgi:hypothetical protein
VAPGEAAAGGVRISGIADLTHLPHGLRLSVTTDAGAAFDREVTEDGPFTIDLEIPPGPGTGQGLVVEIRADSYFVTHVFRRNFDFRPLSWKLASVRTVQLAEAAES